MKKVLAFAALVMVATAFTSCKKDDDKGTAKLLVVHASPDAPGVDLLIDNTKKNSSPLTFPNNTGYLTVDEGTRNIKVNVSSSGTNVINADVPFVKDENYSLFAIDSVSKLSTLLLQDDLTAPASGKAHIRFVHLSPNAPAVDIVEASSNTVVFDNVSFKGYSAFTPLAAGTYNLDVRLHGTATTVLSLTNVALSDGMIYTVFAKGFVGGTGSQALGAEIIMNN